MEVATAAQKPQPSAEGDPKGAAAIDKAADGGKLTDGEERSALEYLLGGGKPTIHEVPVQYMTDAGLLPMTFEIRQMDGRRIDAIEQANINENTGRPDVITAAAQIVAEATVALTDPTGAKTDPKSEQFRTVPTPDGEPRLLASPADALIARFRLQLGLVQGVATEVRRVSGWDAEYVGRAKRKFVEASGN
jgi:hypothetical protein